MSKISTHIAPVTMLLGGQNVAEEFNPLRRVYQRRNKANLM